MSDTGEFGSRQLVLSGDVMPAPRTVVSVLRENLHQLVTDARATRGEVHAPEDTYALVRSLMAVREGAADYEFAFSTIRKEVDGFIQDDLELAVGEQDGVPNSGMKVPDVDGTDIAVGLDTRNEYGFDVHALTAAVTFHTLTTFGGVFVDGVTGEDVVAELLMAALNQVVSLGRFQPQVTKVRAFADDVARMPEGDAIAATVRGAVSKTTQFRGIKVERKQGK
jgi:hypothetical protein